MTTETKHDAKVCKREEGCGCRRESCLDWKGIEGRAVARHGDRQSKAVKIRSVLEEVFEERWRQDDRWGEQNHPDGTGILPRDAVAAREARLNCQRHAADGTVSYRAILLEEVAEAFAESDPLLLRAELKQVAAVAVAWMEKIDRDLKKASNG